MKIWVHIKCILRPFVKRAKEHIEVEAGCMGRYRV